MSFFLAYCVPVGEEQRLGMFFHCLRVLRGFVIDWFCAGLGRERSCLDELN